MWQDPFIAVATKLKFQEVWAGLRPRFVWRPTTWIWFLLAEWQRFLTRRSLRTRTCSVQAKHPAKPSGQDSRDSSRTRLERQAAGLRAQNPWPRAARVVTSPAAVWWWGADASRALYGDNSACGAGERTREIPRDSDKTRPDMRWTRAINQLWLRVGVGCSTSSPELATPRSVRVLVDYKLRCMIFKIKYLSRLSVRFWLGVGFSAWTIPGLKLIDWSINRPIDQLVGCLVDCSSWFWHLLESPASGIGIVEVDRGIKDTETSWQSQEGCEPDPAQSKQNIRPNRVAKIRATRPDVGIS